MNITQPKNHILASLPIEIWQAVLKDSDLVHLDLQESLIEPNVPIVTVDFPETGVMSLLRRMDDGSLVEVANIGNEGMVGVSTVFKVFEVGETAFCQVEGSANRINVEKFSDLLDRFPLLRSTCRSYLLTLADQQSRNSGCYRTHTVEQRCARWLLSTQDRCTATKFVLTQEFLALMLGVSRTYVNQAAGLLAKSGLISYVRGKVLILNREGLENASCACYAETKAYYTKVMAAPPAVAKGDTLVAL